MARWLCQSCDWIGGEDELLTAPSPFDPSAVLTACPKCRAVEDIVGACDVPGCFRGSTCGWPDGTTYRVTCSAHGPND